MVYIFFRIIFFVFVTLMALYFGSIPFRSRLKLEQLLGKHPIPDRFKNQIYYEKDTKSCFVTGEKGNLFLSEQYLPIMDEDGILLIYCDRSYRLINKIRYWIPRQLLSPAVLERSFWGRLPWTSPYYVVKIADSTLRLYVHPDHICHPIWQARLTEE